MRAVFPGLIAAVLATATAGAQPQTRRQTPDGARLPGFDRSLVLAQAAAPISGGEQPSTPPMFQMRNGRPVITLADGNLTIQPVARFDVDFGGFFNQPTYATFPNPTRYLDSTGRTGVPDEGVNLRRARLGLQGTYLRDFTYNFTWDFAQAPGTSFDAVKLSRLFELQTAYTGFGWVTPRIGAFTLNSTIPYAMSSFERTQLEPASIVNIFTSLGAGDARLAVGGEARGERWFASLYATDGQTTSLNDGRQRGVVGRGNYLVLNEEKAKIAVGLNGIAQFASGTRGAPNSVNLRDYPEVRLDPARLLVTGTLRNIGTGWGLGPEVQAMLGPVYLQAEYYSINLDFTDGSPGRSFRGYYLDASLPLIGEPRRHDRARGVFVRPRFEDLNPQAGSWGWLELAARWSWVSLNDAPTRGGSQGVFSAALNYYPVSQVRASVQVMNGTVRLLPGTSASPAGADRAFSAVVGRLAFNW